MALLLTLATGAWAQDPDPHSRPDTRPKVVAVVTVGRIDN